MKLVAVVRKAYDIFADVTGNPACSEDDLRVEAGRGGESSRRWLRSAPRDGGVRRTRSLMLVSLWALASTCGRPAVQPIVREDRDPVVTRETGDSWRVEREAMEERVRAASQVDAAGLLGRHPLRVEPLPMVSRRSAPGMALIQGSQFKLDEDELRQLDAQGFVVTHHDFKSFFDGYEAIYAADLPLYVSADSFLHPMYRSYERFLVHLEQEVLQHDLLRILDIARAGLPALAAREEVKQDLDVWLGVARALLDPQEPMVMVAGGDLARAISLLAAVTEASEVRDIELFGSVRQEDFSQFKPRGHYPKEKLESYFRAMMWLGRVDLRLIETTPAGSRLRRNQVEAAVALRALLGGEGLVLWQRIDDTLRGFVGPQDNATLPQIDGLLAALGTDLAGLPAVSDEQLASALQMAGFQRQRVASQLMVGGIGRPMPLHISFGLLGQRYTIDSHVFSQVTWDRTRAQRLMPSPLDVAYAVFGNDQAAALLQPELDPYAQELEQARLLVEEHGPAFWEDGAYNLWLGALRELSPSDLAGLPPEARTEAWGRRLLTTQVASWAELRHGTILPVEQSFSRGAMCEYPEAWVEPYPRFWERVKAVARRLRAMAAAFSRPQLLQEKLERWEEVSGLLGEMARLQRAGEPHTAEQLAFVNTAIHKYTGCGEMADGWYAELFLSFADVLEDARVVADVHTQPTDAHGNPVGRVLHVGTGRPRLMVATVDTGAGPRAYAGVVYGYGELVTEGFDRLDDTRWKEMWDGPERVRMVPGWVP